MSESTFALAVWLPLGTLVPLLLSRLTGADWRGAFIEATLFAVLGLLIYPTMFALIIVQFIRRPNIDLLFILGFVLATGSVLLFRRNANRQRVRRRGPR